MGKITEYQKDKKLPYRKSKEIKLIEDNKQQKSISRLFLKQCLLQDNR